MEQHTPSLGKQLCLQMLQQLLPLLHLQRTVAAHLLRQLPQLLLQAWSAADSAARSSCCVECSSIVCYCAEAEVCKLGEGTTAALCVWVAIGCFDID